MVDDEEVAKSISDLMLEIGAKLNESVWVLKERCSDDEFIAYRDAVSKILTEQLIEVMNPLYRRHPGLRPAGLSAPPASSCAPGSSSGLSDVNRTIKRALATAGGDPRGAIAILEAGLEKARAAGDARAVTALARQAGIVCSTGELRDAARYYEEAIASAPEDCRLHWALADVYVVLGNIDKARAGFARSLELAREQRDIEMVELAALALGQMDPQERA